MKAFHWKKTHSAAGRARRGGLLLATFFTVAAALSLSAATTAGAVGSFGPHANVGSSASGAPVSAGHAQPSTTVAPLNQANIVVTDLSTGDATVRVANLPPIYPSSINCNHLRRTSCAWTYGNASGPDGGVFESFHPGFADSRPERLSDSYEMTLTAGGITRCGSELRPRTGPRHRVVELDQYVFTSGSTPVKRWPPVRLHQRQSRHLGHHRLQHRPDRPGRRVLPVRPGGRADGVRQRQLPRLPRRGAVLRPERPDRGHGADA